jgi:hypothetical protein
MGGYLPRPPGLAALELRVCRNIRPSTFVCSCTAELNNFNMRSYMKASSTNVVCESILHTKAFEGSEPGGPRKARFCEL